MYHRFFIITLAVGLPAGIFTPLLAFATDASVDHMTMTIHYTEGASAVDIPIFPLWSPFFLIPIIITALFLLKKAASKLSKSQ